MKTDRELLELAAKAAGIDPVIRVEADGLVIGPNSRRRWWSPLADDGDALRLAVNLRIDITFFNGFGEVHAEHCDGSPQCNEDYSDDMHATTRRAIVRVAAAIGETMP